MENKDSFKDNVEDYIETKVDIVKLRAIDKAGAALSGTIVGIASAFFGVLIIILLSFAAGFAIGELTGKNSIGFLCIAGFYILVSVLMIVLKEKLITMPIINSLLEKLYYKQTT
jgi:hypothetical protein